MPEEADAVTKGLGAVGYLSHHTVPECIEAFKNGDATISRYPEVFDRFYFHTPDGPTLVDIVMDGTPEQLELEKARKRVEFKTKWCGEHGMRYLALPGSACEDANRVRALLADDIPKTQPAPLKREPRRGEVQRPKAVTPA